MHPQTHNLANSGADFQPANLPNKPSIHTKNLSSPSLRGSLSDLGNLINQRPPLPPANAPRGFTLIELLVAMAIFITVMGGVTLLFTSAIRLTKQGFQTQEAFEVARGALNVIERDLSRAFTSRDHGDVYNFYGTPIGFTFIGLITADDSPNPNLARVTYVIYHDPDAESMGQSPDVIESVTGDPVPTYYLIRYIEPGAEDLESFPIDWTADLPDQPNVSLQTIIGDPEAPLLGTFVGDAGEAGLCGPANAPDVACLKEIEKAAKRELWIQMLSGDDSLLDIWSLIGPDADDDGIPDGLDPLDYVVAENLRFLRTNGTLCGEEAVEFTDFEIDDGTFSRSVCVDEDDGTIRTESCTYIIADLGPGGPPRIGSGSDAHFNKANFDPKRSRVPYFTYREFGTRIRRDPCFGNIPLIDPVTGFDVLDRDGFPIFQTELAPIELQFWNDRRNIEFMKTREARLLSDGIDNDGDGEIDEPDEALGINLGSPLDPRMPVEIGLNFTFFFKSPYPGAPDFSRKFTQRIDLPTGYRRAHDTPL